MKAGVILKKLFGYTLVIGGGLWFCVSLYSAVVFFYAHERILFFFPSLATQVTIEELISHPARFDEKWIRVRGEIREGTKEDAILVPAGSGLKTTAAAGDNQTNKTAQQLYIHNFSAGGIRTLDASQAPRNRAVTIVGEFEMSTVPHYRFSGAAPHIDTVAIINPMQHAPRTLIRKLYSYPVTWLLSVLVACLGFLTLKLIPGGKRLAYGGCRQTGAVTGVENVV